VKAREIVFELPRSCVLSAAAASASALGRAAAAAAVSDELVLWLWMCQGREVSDHPFHAYLASLPSEDPTVSSWPAELRAGFEGTNLGAALAESEARMQSYDAIVESLCSGDHAEALGPREMFSPEKLRWARGMYLSRRFPARYAADAPASGDGGSTTGDAAHGALGCMVPLLDLLNHKDGLEVKIEVAGSSLRFLAGEDVCAGAEVFNNYGERSNEELLFAHGFALEKANAADTYALKLARANADGGAPVHTVYHVRRVAEGGIPSALWLALSGEDEAEAGEEAEIEVGEEGAMTLYRALASKYRALETSDASVPELSAGEDWRWRHVRAYRGGLQDILEEALESVQAILAGTEANGEEDEDGEEEEDEDEDEDEDAED